MKKDSKKVQLPNPEIDAEIPARDGFIFYKTFYDALSSMKPMSRLHLYDAIMRYALYAEEPTNLNTEQIRIFTLIRPQLDANERKRQKKYREKLAYKNNFEDSSEISTENDEGDECNTLDIGTIEYR
ncbi:DUF6291 domain-containing protein [Alistipes putredinis]|uniref:DUF6291 domain-containing protein n=1 Tax=Alistipes putredinis TaxID=28117 RepID=UPI003A8A4438